MFCITSSAGPRLGAAVAGLSVAAGLAYSQYHRKKNDELYLKALREATPPGTDIYSVAKILRQGGQWTDPAFAAIAPRYLPTTSPGTCRYWLATPSPKQPR